jgi:hypothetical protein
LRLFRCISGDHPFKDGYSFYQLRDEKEGCGASRDGSSANSFSLSGSNRRKRESFTSSDQNDVFGKADAFKQFVEVKNRLYRMRMYKNVFVGSEAVDAIVYNGLAGSRREAVQLGRSLARELGLFRHVTPGDHAFCDDFLFFRYNTGDDASTNSSLNHSLHSLGVSDLSPRPKSELARQADAFKFCLDIQDRKYRMFTYKSSFIGSEAVDALVLSKVVKTRKEAVALGRKLENELRLLKHVTGDYPFSDEPFIYRLRESTYGNSGSSSSIDGGSLAGSVSKDDNSEVSVMPLKGDAFEHYLAVLSEGDEFEENDFAEESSGLTPTAENQNSPKLNSALPVLHENSSCEERGEEVASLSNGKVESSGTSRPFGVPDSISVPSGGETSDDDKASIFNDEIIGEQIA